MSSKIEIIECDDQVQDTYDFKGNFPKFIQLVGGTVFYINRYRRIEYK